MRILIACERSGVVRGAFRKLGHEAWSCDLVPAEDSQDHHFQTDIRKLLTSKYYGAHYWDAMIAFPDCTFLCNSGVLRLYKGGKKVNGRDQQRWLNMQAAALFFRELLEVDIPRVGLENPIMHGHAAEIIMQAPAQSIQPYQFGEDASKRTCLWLKNLPLLTPTKYIEPRIENGRKLWSNQTPSGQNKLGPSPTRGITRARTYQGIGDAMALQWGGLV